VYPKDGIAVVRIDSGVQNRTSARNGGPVVNEIRDQLFELFDAIRLLVDMQLTSVPGGRPGVVECFGREFFLTREVAVDAALFQAGRLHEIAQRTAFVSAFIKDRRGCLNNPSPCLFAFGHKLPVSIIGDR
jgi:hypothetical protein